MSKRKPNEPRFSNATIGVIGVVVILALTAISFRLDALPIVGAGPKYTAYFSEAAGLTNGSEVRVAGVKVGVVTDVALDGDKVSVGFRAKDAWLGDDTRASIQLKTVLGQKYLALSPAGTGDLEPSQPIPLERTAAPYDVVEAFSSAAETLGEVDDGKLAESLNTLTAAMQASPEEFRGAVDGMARLSQTISSRDAELRELLEATRTSSRILAERNDDFRRLIIGSGQLLGELNERSQSLELVLASTRGLSVELRRFVAENEAEFKPTLDSLDSALAVLTDHEEQLKKSIHNLAPFYRLYANMLGTGRWFDSVVTNLIPPGIPEPPFYPGARAPARQSGIN
ncbi:phospholipid/cholesterol/gamma-HCH transport system substrate-binding protein [Dietzia kunjamensis subsp. schimae]|uniref:MCE family protein n=2 Tax=Dietzia TaxID=37914 RepID=A0AAE4QUC5_9ACTN|nr:MULTISPECIES: MCE family protein [Dietzia]MBB1013828.1 MCE family protein [Dietzia kunjamensis subsp. schimae]MDV6298384.1 MCE family protein [Dietzia maris]SMO82534.1 phospholipid/cholesterol/gamma-HCH transport system substrate-binding protein [Dietzia kunjamensis subsp. schimae]